MFGYSKTEAISQRVSRFLETKAGLKTDIDSAVEGQQAAIAETGESINQLRIWRGLL